MSWIKNRTRLGFVVFLFSSLSLAVGPCLPKAKPLEHIYLTFDETETAHHIVVNYHTQNKYDKAQAFWDERCDGQFGNRADGKTKKIPSINRAFHSVKLANLKASTIYCFRVGDVTTGFSKIMKFRTLPEDDRDVRIAIGGDMDITPEALEMGKVVARQNPDLVIIGGDLAYANGELKEWRRWRAWMLGWDQAMRAPDGRLIPAMFGIGNHELNDLQGGALKQAPFYMNLFEQGLGDRTFFHRTIGNRISIIFLDSGYVYLPEDPIQKDWLKDRLEATKDWPVRFAVYHAPLYPSVKKFEKKRSKWQRDHFLPLFDQYHLMVGFEHDEHALKRTHRLKNNQLAPAGEGTLYLGDGCWGVECRQVDRSRWYIENAKSVHHAWIVDIGAEQIEFRAIGKNGELLDRAELSLVP